MRQHVFLPVMVAAISALSACGNTSDADVKRALKDVNVIDESNLNEVMLNAADPNEAVDYFSRTSAQNPDRIDLKRGLAKSLIRAGKPVQASAVWAEIANSPEATNDDRVAYADALIRANEWSRAKTVLDSIPPTHETYDRYRLEAMVADANKQWTKADAFYETALGLTTQPGGVLNNWGFSKLSRGDFASAERLFAEALTYDPGNFTIKNNLVLARSAQRKYDLPLIQMTQEEQAQLLYTAALTAIKQGDVSIGRSLLEDAIETSPRHFEQAARALEALNKNVAKG